MDKISDSFFKHKSNRMCVFFEGYGFIPVAGECDDIPVFESRPPNKIGDCAIIRAEGKRRVVKMLKSSSHVSNGTYLVDMGSA